MYNNFSPAQECQQIFIWLLNISSFYFSGLASRCSHVLCLNKLLSGNKNKTLIQIMLGTLKRAPSVSSKPKIGQAHSLFAYNIIIFSFKCQSCLVPVFI
jgi:hypothetical protein